MPSPLPEPSETQRAAARLGGALPARLPEEPGARAAAVRQAFEKCGGFGLFRATLGIAQEGGEPQGGAQVAELWEGLGHACENGGLLFGLGAHALAVAHPVRAHGSDALRARVLEGLLEGTRIGAHAASEAGAGSDAMAITTRAVRDTGGAGGFRISGTKQFVTNGAEADVFVVLAQAEEAGRALGPTALVVERRDGLTVGAPMAKMGLDGASLTSVYLDDVHVPDDAVLGGVGQGAAVFASAMLWERTLILAPQVGAMRRQVERGIAFARSRRQFGKPIGKHQLVAARVVDLYERYVLARGLVRESAEELLRGTITPARACLTKLKLSEWALETHLDAVRLHGGGAYLEETGLEAQLRDAVGGVLYSGTSDMQRVIIAAHLGLG